MQRYKMKSIGTVLAAAALLISGTGNAQIVTNPAGSFIASNGESTISTTGTFHSAMNFGGPTLDVVVGGETITFTGEENFGGNNSLSGGSFDLPIGGNPGPAIAATGNWATIISRSDFVGGITTNGVSPQIGAVDGGANIALSTGQQYQAELFYFENRTTDRAQDFSDDGFATFVRVEDGEGVSVLYSFTATNAVQPINLRRITGGGTDVSLVAISVRNVTTNLPPSVTTNPVDAQRTLGDTLSTQVWSVAAQGTPPLFYQWRTNGVELVGETSDTLSLVSAAAVDYDVIVSNAFGSATSQTATVVETVPAINEGSQIVAISESASFSITMPFGADSYQWKLNGIDIAGAAADTYVIGSAQASDDGAYTVEVTAGTATVESDPVTLTVTLTPQTQLLVDFGPVSSAVQAGFTQQTNGTDVTYTDALFGSVDVRVDASAATNFIDRASAAVTAVTSLGSLAIADGVGINDLEDDMVFRSLADVGVDITISGLMLGQQAIFEAWFADSRLDAGAGGDVDQEVFLDGQSEGVFPARFTTASPSYTNVLIGTGADIVVRVQEANSFSQLRFNGFSLTSLDVAGEPPLFVRPPADVERILGDTVSTQVWSAVVSGTAPILFQWFSDGAPLPGETSLNLGIVNAPIADYHLVASNAFGSATSQTATVVDTLPPINEGSQQVSVGDPVVFSLTMPFGADAYQWLLDGTNITGATSNIYSIASAQLPDAGTYSVQVTVGTVTLESDPDTLTVGLPEEAQLLIDFGSDTSALQAGFTLQLPSTDIVYSNALFGTVDVRVDATAAGSITDRAVGAVDAVSSTGSFAIADGVGINDLEDDILFQGTDNAGVDITILGLPSGHQVLVELWCADTRATAGAGGDVDQSVLVNGVPDATVPARFGTAEPSYTNVLVGTGADIVLRVQEANSFNQLRLNGFALSSFGVTNIDTFLITSIAVHPSGEVELTWESENGFLYNVQAADDPVADNWVNVVEDLAATPPENVFTNASVIVDAEAFRVERIPPPPIYLEDFEAGDGGWIETNTQGTAWEHGVPSYSNSEVNITGAFSGTNCWGTGLTTRFNNTTHTFLRSPTISLAGVTNATLEFYHYRNMEDLFQGLVADAGQVNILDPATLSHLATGIVGIYDTIPADNNFPPTWFPGRVVIGTFDGWSQLSVDLPPEALDRDIVIEFYFHGDIATPTPPGEQGGWYIDDVTIR